MKKLMMMFAIAVATAVANAGTVSWTTGNLLVAADANGGWTSGAANSFSQKQQEVLFSVFYVDSDDYTTYSGMSQKELYGELKDMTANFTASNVSGETYANAAIAKDEAGVASKTYYAVVLAEYTDTNLRKDFYIAGVATGQANTSGTKTIGNVISTVGARTTDGGWQAVPEPTSGLLLLIGMAGLALRRRRA